MEFAFDLAITVIGVAVVGFYTWSMGGHFRSDKMPTGAKLISAVVAPTTLLFLYLTWAGHQALPFQLVGLAMQIAATALFWWAISASRQARLRFAFDPEMPHGIVKDGPYAHVRHPFYTSYLMFWTGWAIATASFWAIPSVVAILVIYVIAARGEERKFAATPMGPQYAEYRRQAGFLWPRLLK